MSTSVFENGKIRQLDGRADAPTVLTSEEVQDPEKLARALNDIRREQAEFRRRWTPRVMFFPDVVVDGSGSTPYRFEHNFGARVRWSVVGVHDIGGYDDLREDPSTDENVLVLLSGSATTLTLRIEEAG